MKIDDLFRNSGIKSETAPIKGNEQSVQPQAKVLTGAAPALAGDAELFLPELLQRFSELVAKRQDLTAGLPASIRSRLTEAMAPLQPELGRSPIGQGITGLAKDQRVMQAAMRQIASELDFVLKNPEFTKVIASAADSGSVGLDRLQSAVDDGLAVWDTLPLAEQQTLSPVNLPAVLSRMAETGTLNPELAAKIDLLNAALDQLPEDSVLSAKMAIWLNSVDPQIINAAQLTGRPDLVKAWAATQALASEGTDLGFLLTTDADNAAATTGTIQALVQTLTREAAATKMATGLTGESSGLSSRAVRFELLLSGTLSRPEALNAFLTMLPAVAGDVSSLFALTNDKSIASIREKLRNTAPKWLIDLSKQMNKPELVDFWVAAKAADLIPWTRLSQMEQRASMDSLKELAISYEQPEAFRESDSANSNGLILQTALYMPGQEKPYPALIQIFEEKKERGDGELPEQEVWIRITLETDHIGRVELSFRLQDKKFLTVFSRFADSAIAAEFQECLPDFEKDLADTPLELKKFAVTQRNQSW